MLTKLSSCGRRRFLKNGMFVSLVVISSIKGIFSSVTIKINSNRRQNKSLDPMNKKIQTVVMKYGGEFAGIKPEIRR